MELFICGRFIHMLETIAGGQCPHSCGHVSIVYIIIDHMQYKHVSTIRIHTSLQTLPHSELCQAYEYMSCTET